MEYFLKNLGFCSFLLVEGFKQGPLRKELIIIPSIKHFKAVILRSEAATGDVP